MTVSPYKHSSDTKKKQVARMFDSIAHRYDFLNHFLSLGIDRYWRKKLIGSIRQDSPKLILDAATGTGDLAIAAASINPEKIFGVDISPEMIAIGRDKILKKKLTAKIELLECDSEKLIFEENKFDAVTIGFGIRNFENANKGLSEFFRVLKPGGKLAVLEFSKPGNKMFAVFYHFYSSRLLPLLGKKISGDSNAYQYLHDSVEAFPSGQLFIDRMKDSGFVETKCRPLTFGIVSIYTGIKPDVS